MKNENATESNAITRTGRVAEIRMDMAVPTEALPETLGLGIELNELLDQLHEFGITQSTVDGEGHQCEQICEPFVRHDLARPGIVEFADGAWSKTTLLWSQSGIHALRELFEIVLVADSKRSTAFFVVNALRARQILAKALDNLESKPALPADPVVFNKEAFQSQIRKTKKARLK